jgi:hypothetical protein
MAALKPKKKNAVSANPASLTPDSSCDLPGSPTTDERDSASAEVAGAEVAGAEVAGAEVAGADTATVVEPAKSMRDHAKSMWINFAPLFGTGVPGSRQPTHLDLDRVEGRDERILHFLRGPSWAGAIESALNKVCQLVIQNDLEVVQSKLDKFLQKPGTQTPVAGFAPAPTAHVCRIFVTYGINDAGMGVINRLLALRCGTASAEHRKLFDSLEPGLCWRVSTHRSDEPLTSFRLDSKFLSTPIYVRVSGYTGKLDEADIEPNSWHVAVSTTGFRHVDTGRAWPSGPRVEDLELPEPAVATSSAAVLNSSTGSPTGSPTGPLALLTSALTAFLEANCSVAEMPTSPSPSLVATRFSKALDCMVVPFKPCRVDGTPMHTIDQYWKVAPCWNVHCYDIKVALMNAAVALVPVEHQALFSDLAVRSYPEALGSKLVLELRSSGIAQAELVIIGGFNGGWRVLVQDTFYTARCADIAASKDTAITESAAEVDCTSKQQRTENFRRIKRAVVALLGCPSKEAPFNYRYVIEFRDSLRLEEGATSTRSGYYVSLIFEKDSPYAAQQPPKALRFMGDLDSVIADIQRTITTAVPDRWKLSSYPMCRYSTSAAPDAGVPEASWCHACADTVCQYSQPSRVAKCIKERTV